MVLVLYCKIFSMDAARRCSRCNGKGRERNRRAEACTRCDGTGIRPDGYTYRVDDPEVAAVLALGDVVECPPTPHSDGATVHASVVALDGERYAPATRPIKSIIRRVGTEWPAQAVNR
jgi:RecJ-like exonuclease